MNRTCFTLTLVGVLALTLSFSKSAQGTVVSASSNGFGLFADIDALLMGLSAGPLPAGVAGTAPAPYSESDTVINFLTDASIPLVVEGEIGAGTIFATATSDVDGLPGSRTTSATAGVVDADIDVTTIPVLGGGITLLGLDGTLESSAQIAGDFGSLVATGSTTIQALNLIINGINVDLSAFVGVAVPPNTGVDLSLLGIAGSTLILNEQIIAPDNSSIVVNAFNLSVNIAGTITADVILGHSEASVVAIPEPSSLAVAMLGLTLVTGFTRRRFRIRTIRW